MKRKIMGNTEGKKQRGERIEKEKNERENFCPFVLTHWEKRKKREKVVI